MSRIYFQKNQKNKLIDHINDLQESESTKCLVKFIKTYKHVVIKYIILPNDLLNVILEYTDEHISLTISNGIKYENNKYGVYTRTNHIINYKNKFNIGLEFTLTDDQDIDFLSCILDIDNNILTRHENIKGQSACDTIDYEDEDTPIYDLNELSLEYLDFNFDDKFSNSHIFFQEYMKYVYNKNDYMYGDDKYDYEICSYVNKNKYTQTHYCCSNNVEINIKNHRELKKIIILIKMLSDVIKNTFLKSFSSFV